MHSLVIMVAMSVQEYHRVRAPFKWDPRCWPIRRRGDREARMTKILISAFATVLLLLVPVARAEDHPEMDAARTALEQARSALQAASHDYAGHRKTALQHVNQALEQIRLGLGAAAGPEKKLEKKETRLEKKDQNIQNRLNAVKQREQKQAQ
jgi:hypothetical protein